MDGPLLGNGDVGAALGVAGGGSALVWWLGKSDMWATNTAVDATAPPLHSDTFYTAIGAGTLTLTPAAAATAGSGFSALQDLWSASVSANATGVKIASGGSLGIAVSAAIVAADENALLFTLRVANVTTGSSGLVPFNFTLAQKTVYDSLPLSAGVLAAGSPPLTWALWSAKGGVAAVDNSMLLMPCDTRTYVVYPSISTFAADAGTLRLRLANGTQAPQQCPVLLPPLAAASASADAAVEVGGGRVSIAACSDADGGLTDWRLVPAPAAQGAPPGTLQLQQQQQQSSSSFSLCAWAVGPAYHNSGGLVGVGNCSQQVSGWWTWDAVAGQLRYNATQCLTAVPPNVNVTVGLAVSVFAAVDGTSPTLAAWSQSGPAAATATALLQPDTDYTVVLTAASNRDLAWAADPVQAALAALARYAGGAAYLAARRAAHAAFWAAYYNASVVYLGEGRQLLEGFWYGAQYLLGSTSRPGKVAPGLWGVWAVLDTNGWNGDYTLDYNAQANFYGACSSNHCELTVPYLDTVGSDWHLELSRQRAAANWLAKGSAGGPGQTSQSMCCGYMDAAYENPHVCPNSTAGGYPGIEMTSHIGPFAGLTYYSDLSLRMVAAMSAMPFIEYADFTVDADFLASRAYPLVSAVGDFYLAYTTPDPATGTLNILNACAQEICGGGPASEANPHHDLAFAAQVMRTLLRWSQALGVDAAKRPLWRRMLNNLAPLPTGTHGGGCVWLEANGTQAQFLSNAAAYTVVYYAALYPAQTVSLSADAATLATAWNTVTAVNAVADWHPVNGLCMAWPPATRCAGRARAAGVLDSFEAALAATMRSNFYPDLDGGGVEQFGATEAVNSALLQSQEGFLRLFPMWPPAENASFASLRARGAFLVTAEWIADAGGSGNGSVAAPVTVTAAPSAPPLRNCSVLDPWSQAASGTAAASSLAASSLGAQPIVVLLEPAGTAVPVAADPAWQPALPVWVFEAAAGATYSVWPPTAFSTHS